MANEKMVMAQEIVKNPKLLDAYSGRYLTIYDQAATYPKFDNLSAALCILADKGWRAVNVSNFQSPMGLGTGTAMMYALLERAPANTDKRLADVLERLEHLLAAPGQPESAAPKPAGEPPLSAQPTCPKCGKSMNLRTVAKGEQAGKQFYVCAGYPECQGVVPAP
jgi:hypothetical protein